MRMRRAWDERDGILTIYPEDCVLDDEASVREWEGLLRAQLDGFQSKVLLLICVDGMTIHPSVGPLYGTIAKDVVTRHSSNWARYGTSPARAMVAVEALNRAIAPHLFDTREAAVDYLLGRSRKSSPRPSERETSK